MFLKLVAQEVLVFHAVLVLLDVLTASSAVLLVCAPVLFVNAVDIIAQVFVLLAAAAVLLVKPVLFVNVLW